MKTIHLVFVYGTLKRGYGNGNRLLKGRARFVGEAVTNDPFLLMDFGGFPGMYPRERERNAQTRVTGEVWEVSDDVVMANLDSLEGHPTFYCRTPIKVVLKEDEKTVDVETYLYQGPVRGRVCADGVWDPARR